MGHDHASEQSVIGTLIVDLYDPKGQRSWLGAARLKTRWIRANSQKNLEKVDKDVQVVKMFKKYPYPAKSK